jgi:protein-S-isoprenylcysteine O-methyltransferase Ste14
MTADRRIVQDGFAVGLIGYAAVALFYSAFDLLAARGALHTVNMLGQAMFRGLRDPSVLLFPINLDPLAIVAYNALHLGIALAIGFFVASLVATAEQKPATRRIMRAVIVGGYAVTVVVVGVLTSPIRDLLPWWSIMLATAAAAILAGAYLVTRHPGLWRNLALAAA